MFNAVQLAFFVTFVFTATHLTAQDVKSATLTNTGTLADRLARVKTVGVVFDKRLGLFNLIIYTEAQVEEHRKIVDSSLVNYKQRQKELKDGIDRLIAAGRNPQDLVDELQKPYAFPFNDLRRLYQVIAVSVDNFEIAPLEESEQHSIVIPFSRILHLRTVKKLSTELDAWFDMRNQ